MSSPDSRYIAITHVIGPRIVHGELADGDAITLADIEQEFSCSRTVAREVQRHLEACGLVSAQRRVGLTVRPRDEWNVFHPDVIHWRLHGPDRNRQLESLTDLRLAIEPRAAFLAARFATREQRTEILRAGMRVVELGAVSSGAEFMEADVYFHQLILKYSGNEMFSVLSPVIESILTWRTQLGYMPPQPKPRAMEDHRTAALAIYRGKPREAAAAMHDLVDEVQEAFEHLITEPDLNHDAPYLPDTSSQAVDTEE
ncbi:FadR/GntR family transcriptional regulator [Trueperella sp. LYQ143]|uniref:FadR/GntR family transcriptional regulator n=1 Tax=unclassified Trueperella TaxID=2630174 RepID=UPI0039830BF0